jgi:hypothetical protein
MDTGNERRSYRTAYLMSASAGYTCLGLALLVLLVEGSFVKAGWIPERTPNAFAAVCMAILLLYQASLAHARMLSQTDTSAPATQEPPARKLVTRTVLLTLAIALLVETFAVGMAAVWHLQEMPG